MDCSEWNGLFGCYLCQRKFFPRSMNGGQLGRTDIFPGADARSFALGGSFGTTLADEGNFIRSLAIYGSVIYKQLVRFPWVSGCKRLRLAVLTFDSRYATKNLLLSFSTLDASTHNIFSHEVIQAGTWLFFLPEHNLAIHSCTICSPPFSCLPFIHPFCAARLSSLITSSKTQPDPHARFVFYLFLWSYKQR